MRRVIVKKLRDLRAFQPDFHRDVYDKEPVGPKTGSRFLQFRTSRVSPGGGDEFHAHPHSEQITYILSGTGKMVIGRRRVSLSKDMLVFIPPGIKHRIRNTGKKSLDYIILWAPPPSAKDWVPKRKGS